MFSDKIIIALDISDNGKVEKILKAFKGKNIIFKVGLQLFSHSGPSIVKRIKESGNRVFLDLKLFDIPNTMLEASKEIALMGVDFFTVHGMAGRESLNSLKEGIVKFCDEREIPTPEIVAVTVLTSFSEEDFSITFGGISIKKMTELLVIMSGQAGINTFVSSPDEIILIKSLIPDARVITPGIRPKKYVKRDDQKRTMTPEKAISLGADYLVIGRPIVKSEDFLKSYEEILREINL